MDVTRRLLTARSSWAATTRLCTVTNQRYPRPHVLNNQRKPECNCVVPRAHDHRVDLVAEHLADLSITGMRQADYPGIRGG
ncbi:MAG: hypothetical protein JO287_19230 [Pseudonocardiales bacterium]|nr:hypothetical protein [Pseudonocardiales bacterium]